MSTRRAMAFALFAICAGGLYFAARVIHDCWVLQRDFDAERVRVLAFVSEDLTRPGTYAVEFESEYRFSHGFFLAAVAPAPGLPGPSKSHLASFAARASLHGVSHGLADQPNVELVPSDNKGWGDGSAGTAFSPTLGNGSRGRYALTVTVDKPASELQQLPHRLVVYDSVCGCETLGTTILIPASTIVMLLAAGLGGTGVYLWRSNPRPAQTSGTRGRVEL